MRPAPQEDHDRIINLYKGGMTRPAIAQETGWSQGTVSNIIKASGIVGAGRVTGTRTSPETEAQVMALYEQGVTWREIQRITGRTEHTVSAIIKRNGGDLVRRGEITDATRACIPVMYEQGMDAPAIGRTLNCHSSSVYNVLRNAGMDRRERLAGDNLTYFDYINTPDKAYWLGFIGADGCVTGLDSGNPRLVIKLARKDREHLTILHRALQARRPIRDFEEMSKGRKRPYSALTIYSGHVTEALGRHGVTPRKTNTLDPWAGPATLMPHYWRGLIDGDGSITISSKGVWISFVGSEAVVRGFLAWAHEVCGTRATSRQGHQGNKRYWVTQVGGTRRVLELLAVLYDDAPTALTRKKALADLAVHGTPLQPTMF